MLEMEIGKIKIGGSNPCFIVAEIGANHCGDVNLAKKIIKAAADCGVDAVKFQKRDIESLLSKEGMERPYIGKHSFGETYGEHRKVLELCQDEYIKLKNYAEYLGLVFFASAWDINSVDFLDDLGVDIFKTPSACIRDLELLKYLSTKDKPIIISTGMSTWESIDNAIEVCEKCDLALLHCCSMYPAPFAAINLNVIRNMIGRYDRVIGYSGHEKGIAISIAAVALGAKIIERHFTLDRTMKGTDQAASLEPAGMGKLVRDIRAVELAMGDGEKGIYVGELPVMAKLSKSLTARITIPKDSVITREMLVCKSPGDGIPPLEIGSIIGKRTLECIEKNTLIKYSSIE